METLLWMLSVVARAVGPSMMRRRGDEPRLRVRRDAVRCGGRRNDLGISQTPKRPENTVSSPFTSSTPEQSQRRGLQLIER